MAFSLNFLKGGYRKFFYSFISPVGHNICWENSRNGPFGPKNDRKTQIWPFLRSFLGSKFGTIPSGGARIWNLKISISGLKISISGLKKVSDAGSSTAF